MTAPARRERLAELDALTDRLAELSARLDAQWAAVEAAQRTGMPDGQPIRSAR